MGHATHGPLLDALRGLRWPARRAVGAAPPGTHRSRQKGTAGEFTEYRLYRQGDDPRALDWRLLARSDRAFVRLSDDRALLTTWLVVDGSASMAFPEESAGKWRLAQELAVGLAAVAHASSDPVGLLVVHGAGVTRVPPRTRRGTVQELARVLGELQPGGSAPLAPHIAALPTNARIVVITDCLGDLLDLQKVAGAHGAAGALVECVHVVAREEIDPPAGTFLLRDPERDVERDVERDAANAVRTSEPVLDARGRDGYRERFAQFRRDTAQQWRRLGAGYTEVVTGANAARGVRAVVMAAAAPIEGAR